MIECTCSLMHNAALRKVVSLEAALNPSSLKERPCPARGGP